MSLIKNACSENDKVIVSIYVNPTQFNDKADLKKYPRNINEDLKKLDRFKNIIVYTPKNNETRAFIACRIGNIRLIDNIKL